MRQFIVLFAIVGLSSCGRLDSNYLPPQQAAAYDNSAHATFNKISTQNSYAPQPTFNKYSNLGEPSGPINKAANNVPILRLDNNNDGETYNYALETGNGISFQEQGDASHDGTNAQGGFSYTAPDGQQIAINYIAGENGFIPQGAHIPTPPPVPAEILKALEQNLADEAKGIVDDGQYKEQGESGQYYGGSDAGYAGYKVPNNRYITPNNNGKQGYSY